MNIYDKTHELARLLRESPEYRNFQAAKEKVNQNPEVTAMLNEFTEQSMKLQPLILTGGAPPEEMQRFQSLSMQLMAIPLAGEYLQAQMALSKIVGDIYNIIGEVVR